ncbi:S2611 protein, partial [Columbina picui]|nr:S2611 protein [Columbina picui]
LPVLRWLPRYSLAWLQLDLLAGLSVGLTAVPQALAYAELAGLPLQYGLYSSFMGCFVYCILGTAKDVTLGPTAIMSLLVSSYAFHEPVYAVLLAFLSGCIQLAMGLLHLGFLLDFISCPVIKGFTSAASVTISFNQVKNVLGLQGIPRQFFLQVYETLRRIGETRSAPSLCLPCFSLLPLQGLRLCCFAPRVFDHTFDQFLALLPLPLAFLLLCAAPQPSSPFSNFPSSLSPAHMAGWAPIQPRCQPGHEGGDGRGTDSSHSPASASHSCCIFSFPTAGFANVLGSFVSSYPITGSFGRTAVNAQSGVCTPAGGLVTGALVLLSLAYLTSLFYYIPKAALAAVIISAVVPMFDAGIFRTLWRVK